jgi:hypothetical protein
MAIGIVDGYEEENEVSEQTGSGFRNGNISKQGQTRILAIGLTRVNTGLDEHYSFSLFMCGFRAKYTGLRRDQQR